MPNRNGFRDLRTITKIGDEDFLSKNWSDFDHSQKIGLGVWGSAWTIKDKKTSIKYVLQSCHQSQWSLARHRLLQLGRQRSDLFVAPVFLFFRGETTYVCSNMAGICLAEIIDSTIAMKEGHVAAIIKQLIIVLQIVEAASLYYNVTASNVFISENQHGSFTIRLGAFGRRLLPEFYGEATEHWPSIGEIIARLVYHMLTRFPEIPNEGEIQPSEQIMVIRTGSLSIPIGIEQQLSSAFFDFLEACMDSSFSLKNIALHVFLRSDEGESSVGDLLKHVRDTSLIGHSWRLTEARG